MFVYLKQVLGERIMFNDLVCEEFRQLYLGIEHKVNGKKYSESFKSKAEKNFHFPFDYLRVNAMCQINYEIEEQI